DGSSPDCYLETSKAERHVWLMKCPPIVTRAVQSQHLLHPPPFSADGRSIAKVIVAVDPLLPAE
ncbi:hypothetical protein M569_15324, partial [Genlisea aurea]